MKYRLNRINPLLLKTLLASTFLLAPALAQNRAGNLEATALPSPVSVPAEADAPLTRPDATTPRNYVLGAGDLVTLFTPDLEEISNRPLRINMRGDLNVPLAGHIHAAGLTTDQLEVAIEAHLKKYVYNPDVLVNVTEFHSQPVSVLGAVAMPGVHQLEGNKNLFEVISAAGGLRPESGNKVTITRDLKYGPIPLPNAHNDPTDQFSVASVSAKSIVDGSNPAENILIQPNDVISVSKADIIYCLGAVHKPGGFVVGQEETLTALQVVSLAEGLDHTASAGKARVMRLVAGSTTRTEIPLDIKKLMEGKMPDMALKPDDILYVPNSTAKSIAVRTGEAALTAGTGLAIYARP